MVMIYIMKGYERRLAKIYSVLFIEILLINCNLMATHLGINSVKSFCFKLFGHENGENFF